MRRTILSLILILVVASAFIVTYPSSSESAVLDNKTTWTVQVYGPANHSGCYSGAAGGNFTIGGGGHCSVDNLPAGEYTFCINGGCSVTISVPTQNSVSCDGINPSLNCNCTGS